MRWSSSAILQATEGELTRAAEASHDLQPGGNPLRIAPESVVGETLEKLWGQQCLARFGLDRAAHGVQPRSTGALVEIGDVIIDAVEVVLEIRLTEKAGSLVNVSSCTNNRRSRARQSTPLG